MLSNADDASEPSALPSWAVDLVDTFDVDATVEAVVDVDMPAAWPALVGDVGFEKMLRESSRENIQRVCDSLAGRFDADSTELQKASKFSRAQAEMGIPQTTLQKSYRIGIGAVWRSWITHLEEGGRAVDVDPGEILDAVKESTRVIYAYHNWSLTRVALEHQRTAKARRSSRSHQRNTLIRQILDDDDGVLPTSRDLLTTLEYDVSMHHVAVLLCCRNDADLTSLAAQIRRECSARWLVFEFAIEETVLWVGRPRTWLAANLADLDAALRAADTPACRSGPAVGLTGLRTTFAEVQQIAEVRNRWQGDKPNLLTYRDIRLEALLTRDIPSAARFVEEELGELAERTAEMTRLRETLAAWLASGSHVSAAAELGVHEHTVRNRMTQVWKLLGSETGDRRAEIQVALRLHAMLAED